MREWTVQSVPLLGLAQAGTAGAFDEAGFPAGKGWDEAGLPAVSDEHAYALEISGDAMTPVYRDGDIIVVSPGTPIRRGDRVVVKTRTGEVMLRELKRRTAKSLELQSLNASHARSHPGRRRGAVDRADRVGEPVRRPSSW